MLTGRSAWNAFLIGRLRLRFARRRFA